MPNPTAIVDRNAYHFCGGFNMISEDKKEEIREAADLVEVVGDYVRLKRSGSGFVGLCPFHDEKTPSFNVTPRLGIYKCFGCGVSGDLFSFVMEMEGTGFNEAMRTLAERYGVPLPRESSPADDEWQKEKEGIYHALKFAALFFYRRLRESEEAGKAMSYLEKRGYDGAVIKTFGLGYAPAEGNALLKAAKREGIDEELLLKADLVKPSRRNDGFYDTFRDRLIFPIFNPSGKVIAFAGRVLGGGRTGGKYINSAQTPVYNKSEVVYGINFSKNEIRKKEEVILVEGYTDVITMVEQGIKNVVASSGTALTPRQVRVLKRYGSRLVMIYDSDSAGQAAMKRGMNIALAEGMDVFLLELPEKEDPDSYVKKNGAEAFLELKKKEAQDFVSFSVTQAEKKGKMESPGDQTTVINHVLESIAEMPDPLARQVYVQYLHQKTQKYRNSSDRELFGRMDAIIKRKQKKSASKDSAPHPSAPPAPAPFPDDPRPGKVPQKSVRKNPHYEMELIRLMLQFGREMILYIGGLCNDTLFEDDRMKMFYLDIIERHRKGQEVNAEHYVHREAPFPTLTGDALLERYSASERHYEKTGNQFIRDRNPFKTAKSTIKALKLHYLKRHLADLAGDIKSSTPDEKRLLIKKQKETQREISHMERTSADDLFPDPASGLSSSDENQRKTFEYKMKKEKK
ncbi:MAG: DNA primase [Balneolaceae bacterium]